MVPESARGPVGGPVGRTSYTVAQPNRRTEREHRAQRGAQVGIDPAVGEQEAGTGRADEPTGGAAPSKPPENSCSAMRGPGQAPGL